MVGSASFLINSQGDTVVTVVQHIEDLGWISRLVFFLLFIWVGFPFGYNWTTLVVSVGFAYGWAGVIDALVGTAASSLVTFLGARYLFRGFAQRRIKQMSEKRQLYFLATTQVMQGSKAGFLMMASLRVNPVLTFGMVNTLLGSVVDVRILVYVTATLVGSTLGILTWIPVGILVKEMGSIQAANDTGLGRVNFGITIGIAVLLLIGGIFFARYLAVHVLPNMVDPNMVVEGPSQGSTGKLSSGEEASNEPGVVVVGATSSTTEVIL